MKRIVDVVGALGGLALTWPIIVVAAFLVKLTSKGPMIFSQTRVGQQQAPFTCYKLRTMVEGTKQVGTHEIEASAVTRVGGWLRTTKVDELPQLWNVLEGRMSLVGPRPCLPSQKELIAERRKLGVFEVRPGITGVSQVEGLDMSEPERLAKRDAEYLTKKSFWLDLRLIAITLLGWGQGDKVVKP